MYIDDSANQKSDLELLKQKLNNTQTDFVNFYLRAGELRKEKYEFLVRLIDSLELPANSDEIDVLREIEQLVKERKVR